MAFSDAFLRGFQAGKYEDEKNTQLLSALLNRSSSRPGAAIAPARVEGGGDPLARVNKASADYEAEQLRDEAKRYAEQEAMDLSEQREIDTEMKRRQLAAMPTPQDIAIQKSVDAATARHQGALQADASAVASQQLRQQEQNLAMNNARQKFYQAYVQGDIGGMKEGFNAMFPTSEIKAETLRGRDEKTGKEMDYTRFANEQADFKKDDYGNTYIKYPGEKEWVPFNDQHVRQFMIASNPAMMRQKGADVVGGGGAAGTAGVSLSENMSDKDKIAYLNNQTKNNIDAFEARLKYAEAMSTTTDELGNKSIDPEKYKKALEETKSLMTSDEGVKALNLPRQKGYNTEVADHIGTMAAQEFANRLSQFNEAPTEVIDEQGTQMAQHLINQRRMAEAEILKRYGPNAMLAFQDTLYATGPAWFTGAKQMTDARPFSGKPKSDIMITPGLPKDVPPIPGTESATIDGTPVAVSYASGQVMIKPTPDEPWRPMTKEEGRNLNQRMDKAYAERKELFDNIGKLAAAVNTYGTRRKKGEPTLFEKFVDGVVASQKEAMKGPLRANVQLTGS